MPYDADALARDITELVEQSWRRTHAIKVEQRDVLATKALVRRFCGWRADLSEKERKALNVKAGRIVDRARAGKPQDDQDAAIASLMALELEMLVAATSHIVQMRKSVEKRMQKLARGLPGYAMAKQVLGFGDLGFAVIVGMAGDLARYDRPDKLLKRLGLTPFRRDDGVTLSGYSWRQKGGLSKDEWIAYGYNPRRRADMHAVIAEPLFRQQWSGAGKSEDGAGRPKGRYGEFYAQRRQRTAITHPEWTKAQSKQDGLRIMTQRLVRDLWHAWCCDLHGKTPQWAPRRARMRDTNLAASSLAA